MFDPPSFRSAWIPFIEPASRSFVSSSSALNDINHLFSVSNQLLQQKLHSRNTSQTLRTPLPYAECITDTSPDRNSHPASRSSVSHITSSNVRLSRCTYPSLLRLCGSTKSIIVGRQIHEHIVRNGHEADVFLSNLILQMYCECGLMREARNVFWTMHKHDVYSWNFMIKSCSRYGFGTESLQLFERMQREAMPPDLHILASAISACASEVFIAEGKRLHACLVIDGSESEHVLGTALVNLYGKCGCPVEAQKAFDKMHKRDVVTWSALIDSYLNARDITEALKRYVQMKNSGTMPDRFIIVNILEMCTIQCVANEGKEMHFFICDSIFTSDMIVGNALINMYGKCKSVKDAIAVFAIMPEKDVVSWNTMIAAYAENGCGNQALQLFDEMLQQDRVKPDETTYVIVFSTSANFGAAARGRRIHLSIDDILPELDNVVGAAIMNMYGKCGLLQHAIDVFEGSPKQYVSLWNALLSAYAYSCNGREAISSFQKMQAEGVLPNRDTYACLLSACSWAGMIDEGCEYFESMTRDYGISPTIEHYNCMIYSLGRAKRIADAINLIGKMPVEPNVVTWLNLLIACRNHLDVRRGERVAKHLFQLVPQTAASYVMLYQLYLASNRESDARNIEKMMRENLAMKDLVGCSLIEINGVINTFCADDKMHPQKDEIFSKIAVFNSLLEKEGLREVGSKALDTLEGEVHSEMIALAFGIISTSSRKARIFLIKESRMCSRCHMQMKFISKNLQRDIIVRDADCLHFIKDGVCTCADYW